MRRQFSPPVARLLLLSLTLILLAACGRDAQPDAPFAAPRSNAPSQAAAGTVSALNLITLKSGPHRVSVADLRQAGLVTDPAQLAGLGMTHLGQSVPVLVDGDGDGLIFVAQAVTSEYTRRNVYRLQPDPVPLRPDRQDGQDLSGGSAAGAASFTDRLILEENHRYSPLPESGAHWFWEQVRARRPLAIPVTLPGLHDGPASLEIVLWAATSEPALDPDHHLRVTVNGQSVMDASWDGMGWQTLSGEIPAGLLAEGENRVAVELPGDTGSSVESVFVDRLAVDYPRGFEAYAGRLTFAGPGGGVVLAGLDDARLVFDITDGSAWSVVEMAGGEGLTTLAGRTYAAFDPGALPSPAALQPVADEPVLRDRTAGADYVVIGPPDLLAAATPLLDLRRDQGLVPLAVPIQRIYDDFNHGLAEPQAVRDFLIYAAQAWSPAPRYVLLLGDATYDPKGFTTAPAANRLPSFWVYTVFGGQTVSDVDFARLDDDPLPDLALGRLPARTPAQVTTAVQKILAYESGLGADPGWRQQVLAVADGSESSFRRDAQAFLDLLPGHMTTDLFAPTPGQENVGAETVGRVQAGDFVVAYFGHGSVTQWGKDQLFTVDNAAGLTNRDRLPILLNFTCLTGLFTHPTVESLTESLLWQSGGGAIASLASTSLTLADNQSDLSASLAANLFSAAPDALPLRLGDAFLSAQRQLPTQGANALDVLNTFLLFGDPALVVTP